jgi:succinate dehydrogenase / fumarate reductase iron-sulfur subunit
MSKPILIRIRRQARPDSQPYWQDFSIPYKPGYNMVSVLMAIRDNPVTADGQRVDSPAWEYNCMEEVCGACTMVINGTPRQSCSALVDDIRNRNNEEQPITLEPLSKFPVIRDLMVDRSRIFEGLKQVKAWVEIDGAWDVHERAPRISPREWEQGYLYSRCMSCGCCMEACPQFLPDQPFIGPAVLAQVKLKNSHPTGKYSKTQRLHAIMAEGGLSDCGNAQNCVRVCPKEIPLTTAIAGLGREVTGQLIKDLLG